uniref:GATA transcription factor 26-like n=1 Tax=Nicotiana tabacum TaxID=4097 RepID=A0A1S3YUA6_TOBAC|nr:PREDICTED: GATA transcription factor 26-like [Nicotiana tabacum]
MPDDTEEKDTPLWRPGPPEKPVLCNACGSRWRIKGSLDDYIPKHANKETQSFLLAKLPSDVKPLVLAHDNQRLEVGQKVAGTDGSSACSEEKIDDISSSGSPGSFSENCMQMQGTNGEAAKGPLWNPNSVPRRKRSKLKQYILSPVERLHRQLYHMLQEPEFANTSANEEEILIYQKSKSIPPDEIGNGAMLLISPSTAREDSKPQFTTAENNGSCSSNFRNENSSL